MEGCPHGTAWFGVGSAEMPQISLLNTGKRIDVDIGKPIDGEKYIFRNYGAMINDIRAI